MAGEVLHYETLIRESHLDTFGHVNNARYLELFEEARWEAASNRGYSLREVQESGQGAIVLEVNVQFRKELKLREKIRIETQVVKMGSKIGILEQNLYNQVGELSAAAKFTMGFFDLRERKLISPSRRWLQALGWGGEELYSAGHPPPDPRR